MNTLWVSLLALVLIALAIVVIFNLLQSRQNRLRGLHRDRLAGVDGAPGTARSAANASGGHANRSSSGRIEPTFGPASGGVPPTSANDFRDWSETGDDAYRLQDDYDPQGYGSSEAGETRTRPSEYGHPPYPVYPDDVDVPADAQGTEGLAYAPDTAPMPDDLHGPDTRPATGGPPFMPAAAANSGRQEDAATRPMPPAPSRSASPGQPPARGPSASPTAAPFAAAPSPVAAPPAARPSPAVPASAERNPFAPATHAASPADSADASSAPGGTPAPAARARPTSSPASARPSAPAAPPMPRQPDPPARPTLDPRLDCIVQIAPTAPIAGDRLLTTAGALRRAGSKPLLIEADAGDGHWQAPRSGRPYRSVRIGVLLANRHGPLNAMEYSEFSNAIQSLGRQLGAQPEMPEMARVLDHARALDDACMQLDAQIGLNVETPTALSPGELAALASGLDMIERGNNRFARLGAADEVLFSLSLGDRSNLLTLLLDVPRAPQSVDPWAHMLDCAQVCAERTAGRLIDDAGRPLTDAAAAAVTRQLEQRYASLDAAGLTAGSSAALRVFN